MPETAGGGPRSTPREDADAATRESLPVRRLGPDRVALALGPAERELVGSLVAELRAALEDATSGDPGGTLERLYPPAFPDDPVAQAEWVELVGGELRVGRLARLARVEASLDANVLDDAHTEAWLGILNDLRLALGSRLGVTDQDAERLPAPGDPDRVPRAVFAWLGWLVACLVDAMAGTFPADPEEDAPAPAS